MRVSAGALRSEIPAKALLMDDEIWTKAGFLRVSCRLISERVVQNPRTTRYIIAGLVDVAVDTQRWPLRGDVVFKIGSVSCADQIRFFAGCDKFG